VVVGGDAGHETAALRVILVVGGDAGHETAALRVILVVGGDAGHETAVLVEVKGWLKAEPAHLNVSL
jgi:dihydroxyacetone kinase